MVLSLTLVKKRDNPLYLQIKGEHSFSLDNSYYSLSPLFLQTSSNLNSSISECINSITYFFTFSWYNYRNKI